MENDTCPYSFLPSLEWKFPFIFYIFYFDGSPEGIKTKLQSAQRHDQPRWGDYPDKLDLQYLAGLVRTGQWFDGTHPFISVSRRTTPAELYAPPYFLNNEDKFEYLLVPPGDQL